jgi:hypothetical protein
MPTVQQPQPHDTGRNQDQRKDGDKRNKEDGRDKNQISR